MPPPGQPPAAGSPGIAARPRSDASPADQPWIGRAGLLLLSAPWLGAEHVACAVPVAALRPIQCLLGAEAQLAAFAAALQGTPPLLVLPAPELFQAPVSFAALRRLAGDVALRRSGGDVGLPEQALHLRFGPARMVRLLKGARTAAVLAEQPAAPPIALGEHPFGGGLLPAGVAEALLYAPPASDGTHPAAPRRFDRQAPEGSALRWWLLPERFVIADLPPPAKAGAWPPGLELHALDGLGDGWPDPDAADARAAFIDATSRPGAAAVLLPWNLAHPGSIIPDLVQKLARLGPGQPGGCVPVLLPFNGDAAERAGVASLVRDWLAGSPDPAQAGRTGFVARLRDPAAAAALRHSIPFAWLDGGDPEHGWTLRRLTALGVRAVTLRPPGLASAGADVTAEERLPLRVRDASGARLYRAASVAARRLPALMAITLAPAPVLAPPASPASAPPASGAPTLPVPANDPLADAAVDPIDGPATSPAAAILPGGCA